MQLDWNAAVDALRETLPQAQFQNWLKPVAFLRANERSVVLGVPSRFHEEWVKANYSRQITQALRHQCGADLQLEFEIQVKEENELAAEAELPLVAPPHEADVVPHGRPALRIVEGLRSVEAEPAPETGERRGEARENETPNLPVFATPFIDLDFNHVAYQMAGVFTQGRTPPFPCLVVQAGVGMGKTHLLSEIGRWFKATNPDARVRYLSAETFGAEYVRGIRSNTMMEFKRSYAFDTDCLLFDDIQGLAGKEKFQEALLHIFNDIVNRGGRMAFSCSTPIHRVQGLIEPLRSRLVAGVVAEIKHPSFEDRVELLGRACEWNQIFVEATALRALADRGQKDIRELMGTLVRAHLQARFENKPLDQTFVQSGDTALEPPREAITMAEIVALVEHNFAMPRAELESKSRKEGPTWARQVIFYLARTYTLLSLAEIGKTFGRDHATVLHGHQKVVDAMESHPQKRYQVEFLKKKLQARVPQKV